MVTVFSDGQTLRGKEAEKFSLFDEAFKLVLQAYANGAFQASEFENELYCTFAFLRDFQDKKEALRQQLIQIERSKKRENLS